MMSMICLGVSFISRGGKSSNQFTRFLSKSMYATYYMFASKRRHQQSKYFYSNPDMRISKQLYNMTDSKFLKMVYNLALPKIQTNVKIYIPMLDKDVTLEWCKNFYSSADNEFFRKNPGDGSPMK